MFFLLRPFYICFFFNSSKVHVAYYLFPLCFFLYFRRDLVAFKDEFGDITIGHVGESFWSYGTLSTRLANLGVSMLAERFKGSQTMIVPYNLCVSIFINFITRPPRLCLLCYKFFISAATLTFLVLSFWQNSIWNGGSTNRALKKMFSSSAEERVDKKNLVLHFTIFCHFKK